MTEAAKAEAAQPQAEEIQRIPIRLAILCAIVLAFDGFDIAAIGFAIPPLSKLWGLPPAAFTGAVVWGSIGMLLGAIIAGFVGDRLGRRPTLLTCTGLFGCLSVLTIFSQDITTLTLLRFLTGLGLGGAVPTAVALASDYSPAGKQGRIVSLMGSGLPVGIIAGGMISAALLPTFGWQAMFLVGGIGPLAIVPILYAWIPESKALSHPQSDPTLAFRAARVGAPNPILELFKPQFRTVTLLLWVVFVANFLASYLMLLWLPSILNAAGASPSQAIVGTTMFPLAGIVGAALLGWPIDRFGAERTLIFSLTGGAIATAVVGFSEISYGTTMLGLIFGIGLGVSGSQMGMNALSGSAYPPSMRATGAGWALGIGRLGNILGPLLGGILLSAGSSGRIIFLYAAATVLVAALAMLALYFVRRTADKLPR